MNNRVKAPGFRLGASWRQALMAAPLVLLLLALLVYPVGQLLLLSIQNDEGFSLASYRQLFASSVYLNVLLITLRISLWTTLLCVVAAYPVAYLISASSPKRKGTLLFWVLLSFWTSFLVRAFAWVVLLGRNGVINQLLLSLGVIDAPANLLYSVGSVLVGMVHALMPLAVLTMLSVMENIDRNLPRAAATLGAPPGTAFWTVYFPQSLPGVAAAAIMVFVTAIGFFIVPALLGGRQETMITQIIIDQVQQTMNWGFAGAISVLLLVVVLAVFALYDRLLGLSSMTGSAPSRGRPVADSAGTRWIKRQGGELLIALGRACDLLIGWLPRRQAHAQGPSRGWSLLVWALLAFLSVPAFLMIPLSFSGGSGLAWPPKGFSLQWYQQMFDSPLWMQSMLRSLTVALGAGFLSMLIGTPAALLLVRGQMRGKSAMLAFVLSPIIVPRMIIAVGMFYFFARIGLVGTWIGLVLGHTVVAVPYVVMTMMAVLRNYDTRLDLAAQSLGAGPLATLRHVTFPILAAGLLSSFLFAFATSFDELTISLFASGGLNSTLPKQFWDEVTLQLSPVIAAVSTCLFVFIAALIWVADRLRRASLAR
ncbi:putative spermidine/putrescine transport system permease protein [Variovorax boronicumulans]|uniref:Spermidine/putrescine transport system permease protein n=1 Tax=Variovorax boronicumulans TaxID=436515 RepID=A0AAW8DTY6_9BURK|nr:ABC transporter permease subunit [Variovorax boronicumulans]MDP9877509.1 putative spermidine/putrescine transport system permease protein [Variovorax boronicumulans]MDP9920897.1 putative spermidine/putrescine transport system permease protein [Variovorax boronicumulans]MDP9922794.1 putative spermidine/putrescine transport system permease protein [Variovorax boronicumulans]